MVGPTTTANGATTPVHPWVNPLDDTKSKSNVYGDDNRPSFPAGIAPNDSVTQRVRQGGRPDKAAAAGNAGGMTLAVTAVSAAQSSQHKSCKCDY